MKGRKEPPSPSLLYTVYFSLGTIGLLSSLEVAQMALLHSWNDDVFAVLAGFIGTVSGVIIGHHS